MNDRIEQFKKMAQADPENELAHLSLGKAYVENGQFAEAVDPLKHVLAINSSLSKGYELLGKAFAGKGDKEEALKTLRAGFVIADQRGDRMPRDAMARVIKELGETPPTPQDKKSQSQTTSSKESDAGADTLQCKRCGQQAPRIGHRPFKGELGEKVQETICQNCWQEWIGVGTKVINELGLQLSEPSAQQVYDQHMREYLQLD